MHHFQPTETFEKCRFTKVSIFLTYRHPPGVRLSDRSCFANGCVFMSFCYPVQEA